MKDKRYNQFIDFVKWLIKWLLIVSLGIVLLFGAFLLVVWQWEWWTVTRHRNNVKVVVINHTKIVKYSTPAFLDLRKRYPDYENLTDEQFVWKIYQTYYTSVPHDFFYAQLGISVATKKETSKECDNDHPIEVTVMNNSSKTIEKISVDITAHIAGHSTNILPWSTTATSDAILLPEEGLSQCWRFNLNNDYSQNIETATAIYEGKIAYVDFKD